MLLSGVDRLDRDGNFPRVGLQNKINSFGICLFYSLWALE